ncbi:phosphoribosyltransferase [Chitinophaga sp. 22321]|uniref:phosphoribosyltransferase n=1 Tax=Chitinophaga sp. 22321 TaxID=3453909 RepID=UPI003F826926
MFNISHEHPFLKGAWHLVYYIPEHREIEGSYSNHIIKFKDGEKKQIKGWCIWAKEEFSKHNIKFDYIIRALGSRELKVNLGAKGLDYLGKYLEKSFGWQYIPTVLEKNRLTKPLHFLNKSDRESEIHKSYFVAEKQYNFNKRNVLILDDITTSQTTLKEIIRAINAEWPSTNYYLFCLGRTNHNLNGNDHIKNSYFNS